MLLILISSRDIDLKNLENMRLLVFGVRFCSNLDLDAKQLQIICLYIICYQRFKLLKLDIEVLTLFNKNK
jgi:hypothetical protein